MNDSGSDFSQAKVGDVLWLRCESYDGVAIVESKFSASLELRCEKRCYAIKFNGKAYEKGPQALFWDKVEIVPPPRPKRMVKKTVMVRPYYGSQKKHIHLDEKPGQRGIQEWYYCGPSQPIEVEVWED